ncbi:hypothetical protein BDN72DRAFT_883804 [Pluteus cervinus]|uniref:Uncharacterized protein n=1 Tax=Pluteus cervinus TaxID=181527 RepID=A0ACD3A3G3_9AGAR|nr:hypothetical protein BDN72DRAFT_883804 [Pluteus cervinus]
MSIAHALAVADAIRDQLTHGASDPRSFAKTPEEVRAGRIAKRQAEEILASTIATVPAPKPPARAAKVPQPTTLKAHRAAQLAACNFAIAADPASGAQTVVDDMKAANMESGKQSLQDMATAIGTIIDRFDSILTAPYLDQYSATLNTVPVVGIKNNQLLYTQTKNQDLGLVDVWSTFSSLPPNVTINPAKTLLSKTLSTTGQLYNDWTAMGDCLPSPNFAGIAPFAVLSADLNEIAFQLVTLAVDGTISWMTSDQLTPQSTWQVMKYAATSGGPATSPKFTKIVYWNNTIVGVDDASNSWNINVSFQNGTFNVTDQFPIDPITEFTATDGIPFLNGRWILADGVVNLGVASPGVILDMNLMARTLKGRYIDVQTAVYPVVERINAFCTTHEIFFDNVAQAAQDWQNADTDAKRTIAINNAKSFVTHSKTWGGLISSSINSCQQSVTIMTSQLHDVRLQLEAQLKLLHTKLGILQATLQSQQETMSKLQAAFWGSIAATFIGLLMVGGIIGIAVVGAKISDLAGDIAQTKSQIDIVNTAITDMTNIVSAFSDLDNLYGTLNQFWGGISNDATYGAEILDDTSSIQASQQVTGEMGTACQTYLTTLNEQSIIIPTGLNIINTVSVFTKLAHASPATKLPKAAAATSHSSTPPPSGHRLGPVFKVAQTALKARKVEDYLHIMNYVNLLHMNASADQLVATANSGLWFDLPTLNGASNVWMSSTQNFVKNTGVLAASNTLALQSIIGVGNIMVTWSTQFPTTPTNPADIAKLNLYKDQAVKACEDAQGQATLANNSFDDFNHKATAYQQNLEAEVNGSTNQIAAENAQCEQEISDVSPPWYVVLGGPAAIIAWTESEKSDIRQRRDEASLESSGTVFSGHVLSWIEMVQTISGNLGSIHNTLVGVWGQLLEDPVMYSGFMQGEWAKLVRNTEDVLAILNNSSATVALWAVPRQTAIKNSLKVHPVPHQPILAVAKPTPTTSQRVVAAVTPHSKLGSAIVTQANQAARFFVELDVLFKLPFMKDIIGYWSWNKSEKHTLDDVTVALRSDYINMIASEYNAIETLQTLAVLQDFRSTNVVSGKLPVKTFVSATLTSIRAALKATTTTNVKFKASAKDFEAVLRVVNTNISTVEQHISGLCNKTDEGEKAEREKVIRIVADAIALVFSSSVLLTSFGVIGPVGAALDLAVRAGVGAGAASVGAGVRTVLDSLSSYDLDKVVTSLKATGHTLQHGVDQLKKVQSLFGAVVMGVSGLNRIIQDMQGGLVAVQSDVDFGRGVKYTQEDSKGVQVAWRRVCDDAQVWLDVVIKRGVVAG